jgi:probable HAF family extracellular repeat protein
MQMFRHALRALVGPRNHPRIRPSRFSPEPLEPRRLLSVAYSLIDLGTLGGGESQALDLNDSNQVVGYALDAGGAPRAFLFSDANGNGVADPGEMVDLRALPGDAASYAYGVSNGGQVVGTSRSTPAPADGDERAVRFNPGSGPTDLGLGAGSNAYASNATDVNGAGQIVGGALSGLNYQPFLRSPSGTVSTFTLPAPFNLSGEAHGVNSSGVVVGYSGGFAGDSGFIRTAGGAISPVGFPDAALPYNYAWDVSDSGFVAGEGFNSDGEYHAFRYEAGTGEVVDLGTLTSFGSSEGYGVNDRGDVVGRAEPVEGNPGPTHAFLYRDGMMQDLNDLVEPGTGWVLAEARAINSAGAIAGFGTAPGGATRGFLLVPRPAILGRYVFYNNSSFDGRDPAANEADDNSVAPDKHALLPGQVATFDNATSYARGINGVMIDIGTLGGELTSDDFVFRRDNNNLFNDWSAAPAPSAITVRPGAGADGSDRVTITWPDGEIRNEWLEVTILPSARTGLSTADRFYFGNSVGETGDPGPDAGTLTVNAIDLLATRRRLNTTAPITSPVDFDRDGRVGALDLAAVRRNYSSLLVLIRPPAAAASPTAASHEDLAALLA